MDTDSPQNSSSPAKGETTSFKQKIQIKDQLLRARLNLWKTCLPLPRLQFPTVHFKTLFVNKVIIPWERGAGRLLLRVHLHVWRFARHFSHGWL